MTFKHVHHGKPITHTHTHVTYILDVERGEDEGAVHGGAHVEVAEEHVGAEERQRLVQDVLLPSCVCGKEVRVCVCGPGGVVEVRGRCVWRRQRRGGASSKSYSEAGRWKAGVLVSWHGSATLYRGPSSYLPSSGPLALLLMGSSAMPHAMGVSAGSAPCASNLLW